MQGAFLALLWVRNWDQQIPLFLGIYFVSFLAYGVAARLAISGAFDSLARLAPSIFICAVLFRLTIFWCPPTLSQDIYRYIWDGRVQASGLNPYEYPPEAPQLTALRDENFEKISYKWLRTTYPPAAEILFHLLARTGDLHIFKLGILCFDLLLIEVLRRLLKKENLSPAFLLLYAWHPLPIIEFAGSGHMDVLGISLLLTSYLLLLSTRNSAAGATLAFAALTKYIPVFGVPWMIRKGGWKFLGGLAVALLVLLLPYYTPDLLMIEGLHTYYRKWRFNDSLFGIFYAWFGGAEPARHWGLFFVITTTVLCWVARYSFYRSLFMIYGAIILFSPVVHPWYICWIIPFLVFHPNGPWLFFSGWVALSYLILYLFSAGVWKEVLWLKLLIYVPLYAMLFWNLFRAHRNRVAEQAVTAE